MRWIKCLLIASFFHQVLLLPKEIRVGGIFEVGEADKLERAFRQAIKRFNFEQKLPGTFFLAEIRRIPRSNSYQAINKVCELFERGVAAIFGPQSNELSQSIGSALDSFDIPHLETRFYAKRREKDYTFNLYPDWETIVAAMQDLIKIKRWTKFAILYEDNEALLRMQMLLQQPISHRKTQRFDIKLRKLTYPYRAVFRELREANYNNILLDCKRENLYLVLKQAQQVGLINSHQSYIITNLDFHTVNVEDFKHSETNITAFRIVDPENPKVISVVDELKKLAQNQRYRRKFILDTKTALMFDAVSTFADAIRRSDEIKKISFNSFNCSAGRSWSSGSLYNQLQMTNLTGITGNINFNHRGLRSNIKLDIVELTTSGLAKVGVWNRTHGLQFARHPIRSLEQISRDLRNKTLRITTYLNKPYTMVKESSTTLRGNDRFEGFCIDLIEAIAQKLHFKYEIIINKTPGKKDANTGNWSGMIGELLNNDADLALGDLTITVEREEDVGFTTPFMNLGISILFRKPTKSVPSLVSFLSPLSVSVWIYMLMAYVGVSVFLFIVARFSPYEWVSPHPCNQESDVLENQFSLMNSLWFTIGSLMQQGSDLAPTAWSTRMIAATWWFFTLIMISSYTANLAAFLTVQKMVSPIESADDLARQTKIKYGCYKGGSTENFFRNSTTHKRMWEFMNLNRDSVMVTSSAEGVRRVLEGNYAYLMESTSIEYQTQRNCDLTQVGGLLDSKGYGIAYRKDSEYGPLISSAILKLQEETVLDVMKVKWWTLKRGGGRCSPEESKGSTGTALTLRHVGGVFVVLLGGVTISWLIGVFEFIHQTRKTEKRNRASLCIEILKELKYALSCESSTRQVPRKDNLPQRMEEEFKFSPYPEMNYREAIS